MKIDTASGPTLKEEEEERKPLPDIAAWNFAGAAKMPGGTLAWIWTLSENHGEKTNAYTFYTAQADGRPLKLVMAGVNLFSGRYEVGQVQTPSSP